MTASFLHLRVVYEDLPDLIELAISVRHGGWAAESSVYASPQVLADVAAKLVEWVASPGEPFEIEEGADNGIGWMRLKFYTIDRAGHARCAVCLSTGGQPADARPEETWRFAIEIPTELGLIERFGRECVRLSKDSSPQALLEGLPA